MEIFSRSGETGLTTKSSAPARMALTTVSIEPWAVCTITGRCAANGLQPVEELQTIHARHHQVEHDELETRPLRSGEDVERPGAAIGGLRDQADALDHFLENATLGGIVFDYQCARSHVPACSPRTAVFATISDFRRIPTGWFPKM